MSDVVAGARRRPPDAADTAAHEHPADEVAAALEVDPDVGLDTAAVRRRRAERGRNVLPEPPGRPLARRVADQLRDPMALLLLAAAAVSGAVLGEAVDAVAIAVIVVVNAAIALVQEGRAASALAALRALEAPRARVRRDGAVAQIDAGDLVPGDLVLLDAGDRVPADLRLLTADALEVDESILTGESLPVTKDPERLAGPEAGLGDRAAVVHSGTHVTRGRATGVVVATGTGTTLGAIARDAAAVRAPTPLQVDLAHVTARLGTVSVLVAVGVLALTLARGGTAGFEQAFLAAVALAVAAVPEGLATVTTVGLALGVRRMAERGAIVRRLSAVETLGSVTALVVDKTGTLTENRMRVAETIAATGGSAPSTAGDDVARAAAWDDVACTAAERVMTLCNDAQLDPAVGDPTEIALLDAVGAARVDELRARWRRVATTPFDSTRKRMTTVHAPVPDEGGESDAEPGSASPRSDAEPGSASPRSDAEPGSAPLCYELGCKGAPETVLPRCVRTVHGRPLDDGMRQVLDGRIGALAVTGTRLLALARRGVATVPSDPDAAAVDLELVGLVGLRDPVREVAAESVDRARRAGVTMLMATGDHPGTASAVASEVGLAADDSRVVTGAELRRGGPAGADDAPVFARVDPGQKLDLVDVLQRRGEVVGMTGDGVNDAPALRRADIGIALGRRGSDLAREASDMVITDDDLATIVAAIGEGRAIYDNLRKAVDYLVAGNLGEILVVVAGLLFVPALGVPLLPLQLLWINLVTDGLPAIALGVDAPKSGLMQRPPRPPGSRLLTWTRVRTLLGRAAVIAAAVLVTLVLARTLLAMPWPQARTVLFTALVVAHLGYAYVVRRGSGGALANRWLLWATLGGVAAQALLVVVPAARELFGVTELSTAGWLLALTGGVVPNLVLWPLVRPSRFDP